MTFIQGATAGYRKPVVVVKKAPRRVLPSLLDGTMPTAPRVAPKPTAITETPHERVIRLIREGEYRDAASLAARLVNAGDFAAFFKHSGTPLYDEFVAWYHGKVVDAPHRNAFFIDLTPEIAQVLLQNNHGNRRLKSPQLEKLIRDIACDRWAVNGESVIVARGGMLNDGQHRCWAVVLVGRSVETLLSVGVERATMNTVDIGAKREGADRLGIAGVGNSGRASALAGLVFYLKEGRAATESELVDFYFTDDAGFQRAMTLDGSNIKGVGQAATGAAAYYLTKKGHAPERVKEFFDRIHDGEMMTRNDPRMVLYKAARVDKVKLTREQWAAAFVRHFIEWSAGGKVRSVMCDPLDVWDF